MNLKDLIVIHLLEIKTKEVFLQNFMFKIKKQ